VYYLARNAADTPGLDALRAVSIRDPKLRVFALLAGEDARAVRARVEALSAPLAQCEAYVCGPPGMLQESLAWLVAAGVPPARIHAERFDFR
jgi:CDP-4-dehydro-6-deoxyglucose reductase, E3